MEVLTQSQIDDLINGKTSNTAEGDKATTKVTLVCMHCGIRIIMPSPEKSPLTAYMAGRRTTFNKECTSEYGHAFITPERLEILKEQAARRRGAQHIR